MVAVSGASRESGGNGQIFVKDRKWTVIFGCFKARSAINKRSTRDWEA